MLELAGTQSHVKNLTDLKEGEMTSLGMETTLPLFKILSHAWIRGVGDFLPDFESGSSPKGVRAPAAFGVPRIPLSLALLMLGTFNYIILPPAPSFVRPSILGRGPSSLLGT